MKALPAVILLCAGLFAARAATLGTFRTSVGTLEVEFYDDDKPVTVSNFLHYATSGKFDRQFIQRWVPGFVIQAGGYRVVQATNGPVIDFVDKEASITNEFSVGRPFSNTFATLAMARIQGQTNSASSEWFINLSDQNTFLDKDSGGFTVFAKVTGGTNLLNPFIPSPGANGTNAYGIGSFAVNGGALSTVPVLAKPPTYDDLIYVDISLRRAMDLQITQGARSKTISWNSVAGVTNVVEFATTPSTNSWTEVNRQKGTGARMSVLDTATADRRFYRVKLLY